MNTKKPIILLLSITLLLAGNLQSASAQNLDALSDYSIKLAISPSHLESARWILEIQFNAIDVLRIGMKSIVRPLVLDKQDDK